MSRRYARAHPPVVFLDWVAMHYGVRGYQGTRPMPGCAERCCGGGWSIAVRVNDEITDRVYFGLDLVPGLAITLFCVHAFLTGWRLGGGL